MGQSVDLVVLGAGPAGLAAAWRAARRGMSVVVLERADRVGGLAASFEVAGIRVDHGSHRLHPATPPHILADLRGLLRDDLQQRPRNGRLRIADRFVGFPLKGAELALRLPPYMIAKIARDTVAPRAAEDDSFAAVLRAGLGPTLYEALYAPYAMKLWGLPGEEIDGDQARKRVAADSPWKIAGRIVRGGPGGQGKIYHYPRRGFGQIAEALADAAADAGAQIRLSTACEQISATRDGVIVVLAGGGVLSAGHVFSTIPMPTLARLVRPGPPAGVLDAAAHLRFRAMVLVYAVHEGGRWSGFDAHYLPGPDTPVTRISEPTNYRVSAADPTDRSVVCFEIPCTVGDELWSLDDPTELITDCLARSGLPPLTLGELVVRRLPHVYPVYRRGYAAHLASLDLWIRQIPRVTTFGRLGLFAHDNTHHAIAMAYDAVDALTPDGWNHTAWTEARTRFAHHVVED